LVVSLPLRIVPDEEIDAPWFEPETMARVEGRTFTVQEQGDTLSKGRTNQGGRVEYLDGFPFILFPVVSGNMGSCRRRAGKIRNLWILW
jgi:hypothetical protein